MSSRTTTLPTRLVARHSSALLLARATRWLSLLDQDHSTATVYATILAGSIAHLPLRDPDTGQCIGIENARYAARSISAMAIAQSMRMPLTTVRRRTRALVAAGLAAQRGTGFGVTTALFADPRLADAQRVDRDHLVETFKALAQCGYAPAIAALEGDLSAIPVGAVARQLVVFELRMLETFTTLYGDTTAGTLMTAIIDANVRHITQNPDLARRYADSGHPPPDDLRVPIPLRELARTLDLPFETVRRRVAGFVEAELVTIVAGGAIVPTRVLMNAEHVANNRRGLTHFEQLIDALVGLAMPAEVWFARRRGHLTARQ